MQKKHFQCSCNPLWSPWMFSHVQLKMLLWNNAMDLTQMMLSHIDAGTTFTSSIMTGDDSWQFSRGAPWQIVNTEFYCNVPRFLREHFPTLSTLGEEKKQKKHTHKVLAVSTSIFGHHPPFLLHITPRISVLYLNRNWSWRVTVSNCGAWVTNAHMWTARMGIPERFPSMAEGLEAVLRTMWWAVSKLSDCTSYELALAHLKCISNKCFIKD